MNTKPKRDLASSLAALATAFFADGPSLEAAQFTKITNSPPALAYKASYSSAWADIDKDGYPDLIVGNCHTTMNVYKNVGGTNFVSVTSGPLAITADDSSSVLVADLHNAGNLDVLSVNLMHPAPDNLFRGNPDGTFTKIAYPAYPTDTSAGVGGAFVDYDRDGLLDVVVANGVGSGSENEFLYHNEGNGKFTPVKKGDLVGSATCCDTQSIAAADYDGDGWPDLAVASLQKAGLIFFRNKAGEYLKVPEKDLGFTNVGQTMGISAADFDNDGLPDLALGTYKGAVRLYRNVNGEKFEEVIDPAIASETKNPSHTSVSWADVDNNGWADLFVAGVWGHPNHLFLNHHGKFALVTDEDVVKDGGKSNSGSFGDIDNDGQQDLFVANAGSDPYSGAYTSSYLYHNNGTTNGWVMLNLVGGPSNRSAVGAKVYLKATIEGEQVLQYRAVAVSAGWTSPNELRVHFGLGDAKKIDSIEIHWPSGIKQEISNPAMRKIHTVVEPPRLRASGVGRIQINGAQDVDYTVEGSDDLRMWTRAGTEKGGGEFVDAEAPNFPHRYYRALGSP